VERHDGDPLGRAIRGAVRRPLGASALILITILALGGCGTGGPTGETSSPATARPSLTTEEPTRTQTPVRFLIKCYSNTGDLLGTFTRLDQTWASTNYMQIGHCVAVAVAQGPLKLTAEEATIANTAASQVDNPGTEAEVYLKIVAVCTRVGSEDGPYGFSSIPVPVLQAALLLCPEAPQANIIRERVGRLTRTLNWNPEARAAWLDRGPRYALAALEKGPK
jgi:hypothetical protein